MQPTPDLIQASANPRRAHLTHIDFLRIFAIFLVILNHSGTYFMPTDEQGTIKSCLLFFSNQIIKTGVPIFFMISGALLLPREESYSQLFQKRILRILGVIIIFWSLQLSADALINGTNLSLGLFLQSCYTCNYVPLQAWTRWFLYAYLAVLLLLPMLRLLARGMKDRDFIYLFGLQFIIMAFTPTVICLMERSDSSLPGKLASYLPFHPAFGVGLCSFYMLMGYFLEHRIHTDTLSTHTGGGIIIL